VKLPEWIANLPTWLKVVLVLVLVLGVCATGVGAGRTIGDPPHETAPDQPKTEFNVVPAAAVPAREIAVSSCSPVPSPGQTRFKVNTCRLTVTPSGLLPRELRLTREAGSGTMTVSQEIQDKRQSSTKGIPEHIAIRVATSPVTIEIDCPIQCQLLVNE
jgi:hypothetical protein